LKRWKGSAEAAIANNRSTEFGPAAFSPAECTPAEFAPAEFGPLNLAKLNARIRCTPAVQQLSGFSSHNPVYMPDFGRC
jgi:hypothetical protein